MSHAVIIKNAVKKYGDFTALNGVSLDIKQGEFFTLLGPSGMPLIYFSDNIPCARGLKQIRPIPDSRA